MHGFPIADCGDVREVHHICCLVGYGLDAVCPRLALEVIHSLVGDDRLKDKETGDPYLVRDM